MRKAEITRELQQMARTRKSGERAGAKRGGGRQDAFYRKAKAQNLRARSAFKIDEVQRRWKLVRQGDAAVDLGASPGGFLQILGKEVGQKGRIVGVDLDEIQPLAPNIETLVADVYDEDLPDRLREALGRDKVKLVTSDLAPKTTGIRSTDEARSLALCERALDIARELLEPGGHFVAKIFMGAGFEDFAAAVRSEFHEQRILRPEATRTHSREAYVVGLRWKGN